jgi:hypothetical protein
MVTGKYEQSEDQYYAPAVCAECGEQLGWIGVSEHMKDYTFKIMTSHEGCRIPRPDYAILPGGSQTK